LKLKYLIIVFGIIFFIVLFVTALIPFLLGGPQFATNFQYITFPLLLFMFLLLIVTSIFFFYNYRLLSLLEREDWPALAYYLEQKVYGKNQYSNRNVRLLASSYLVVTDYVSVLKLENKALQANPAVIGKNLLLFGSARVLSGNHKEAALFFKSHLEKGKLSEKDEQWARWYYGFSQLLTGAFKSAGPEFSSLAVSSRDVLVTGLSSYFLNNSIAKHSDNTDECLAAAESGKIRVKSAVKNITGWNKDVEKMKSEIYIAIIKKYLDEARQWLFSIA